MLSISIFSFILFSLTKKIIYWRYCTWVQLCQNLTLYTFVFHYHIIFCLAAVLHSNIGIFFVLFSTFTFLFHSQRKLFTRKECLVHPGQLWYVLSLLYFMFPFLLSLFTFSPHSHCTQCKLAPSAAVLGFNSFPPLHHKLQPMEFFARKADDRYHSLSKREKANCCKHFLSKCYQKARWYP